MGVRGGIASEWLWLGQVVHTDLSLSSGKQVSPSTLCLKHIQFRVCEAWFSPLLHKSHVYKAMCIPGTP